MAAATSTAGQQAAEQQAQGQQNTLSRRVNSLRAMLERGKGQLQLAMAKHLDPDRMIRLALTAASRVPRLLECTPESIGLSLLTASQLGIEPNGRDGHLVPYWNSQIKGFECQFIPDFKGLIKLAYRNPRVQSFQADAVREGDTFEYEYGTNAFIRHKPSEGQRGELTHAYAICKLKDADPQFVVMPREKVLKRKAASQTGSKDKGPWKDWPDEMWAKTAVKALSKFVPLGGEFEQAVEHDNKIEAIDVQFSTAEPAAIDSETDPRPAEEKLADKVEAAAAKRKKAPAKPAEQPAPEAPETPAPETTAELTGSASEPPADVTFLERIDAAPDKDTLFAIDKELVAALHAKQLSDKSFQALRKQIASRKAALGIA